MWQINRITKDTLLNISKYSNKVIKIARFVQESNQPFLMNNLLGISNQTDQIEILTAFDKDLIKTTNDFFEIQKLLITVDENGYVKELEGDERNIGAIFGDFYNVKTKVLSLPTIDIDMSNPSTIGEIRESIVKSVFGFNYSKYKELMKIKDDLSDINKEDLLTDNDKINYLTSKADIDFVKDCADKISAYTNSFVTIRKKLDFEEKDLIDSKITSGRTMVDGILSTSTYISKKDGIYQISPTHKKDFGDRAQEILKKIEEEIIKSGYVSGVEIDQDTDLEKFLFLMKKIRSLHLNLDMEFEFKTRKLGNYMANGIYIHDKDIIELMGYHSDIYNIVSVDVNSPSALIHELTHLVDLSNKEFSDTPERAAIVRHFTEKLSIPDNIKSLMSTDYQNYLYNNKEVIARLGEIGYLLNKVDYQGHKNPEELENYYKKIRMMEMIETAGDKEIPIVHKLDFYRKNSFMYFDIDNLKEEELISIKEYYKSYYNVLTNEFMELKNSAILRNLKKNADSKVKKEVTEERNDNGGTNNRFSKEKFPMSKVNLDNIVSILEYNDKEKIFSNKELAIFISTDLVNIDRRRLSEDLNHYLKAYKVVDKVFEYALATGNKELERELCNSMCLKASRSYQAIKELNKTVEFSTYIDLYVLHNSGFTQKEAGYFQRFTNDTLSKAISNSAGTSLETSIINTRIRPEIEIDRSLILDQITNRLEYLQGFNKEDIFLHKSLHDMTHIMSSYADNIQSIFKLENLMIQRSMPFIFDEKQFTDFSNLLKAEMILEDDKIFSNFKDEMTRTLRSFRNGYTKRPVFELKFEGFEDEVLLRAFDLLKNNLADNLPSTLKSNKGLQDSATDKQKLAFLHKLSFKNFEYNFIKDFIENIDLKEIKRDNRVDIFTHKEEKYTYSMSRVQKLINNQIEDNKLITSLEVTKSALGNYSAKYRIAKMEGEKIDEVALFKECLLVAIDNEIEKKKEFSGYAITFLENNKDTLIFLKGIQNKISRFMVEKGVAEDYIIFLNENLDNNKSSIQQANSMIRKIMNVSSVNIEQEDALLKIAKSVGCVPQKRSHTNI